VTEIPRLRPKRERETSRRTSDKASSGACLTGRNEGPRWGGEAAFLGDTTQISLMTSSQRRPRTPTLPASSWARRGTEREKARGAAEWPNLYQRRRNSSVRRERGGGPPMMPAEGEPETGWRGSPTAGGRRRRSTPGTGRLRCGTTSGPAAPRGSCPPRSPGRPLQQIGENRVAVSSKQVLHGRPGERR